MTSALPRPSTSALEAPPISAPPCPSITGLRRVQSRQEKAVAQGLGLHEHGVHAFNMCPLESTGCLAPAVVRGPLAPSLTAPHLPDWTNGSALQLVFSVCFVFLSSTFYLSFGKTHSLFISIFCIFFLKKHGFCVSATKYGDNGGALRGVFLRQVCIT